MIQTSACHFWQPDRGAQPCTDAAAPTPRGGARPTKRAGQVVPSRCGLRVSSIPPKPPSGCRGTTTGRPAAGRRATSSSAASPRRLHRLRPPSADRPQCRSALALAPTGIGRFARGAGRQVGVDLEGVDRSARSGQMGKDRGVVAAARPDMQDRFVRRDRKRVKAVGIQARFVDVDASRRVKRDQNVLIEKRRVVRRALPRNGRRTLAISTVGLPSPRSDRPFADRRHVK